MKRFRLLKLLIFIIIVILLFSIVIYYIIKKQNYNINSKEEEISYYDRTVRDNITLLRDTKTFYTIFSNINKYIKYVGKENKTALYDILDKSYIIENSINSNNILEYTGKYTGYEILSLEKVFYISQNGVSVFVALGKIENYSHSEENGANGEEQKFSIIIKQDNNNMTYAIYPYTCKDRADIKIEKLKELEDSIEKKQYNTYEAVEANQMQICNNYFNLYKNKMLNYTDESYKMLDEEYVKKRFNSNIEKYREYVKNKKSEIIKSKIEKYTLEEKEDYRKYICVDNLGNYYIFKETSPMQYTVLLDSYTVPTDEFINRYNSSNEKLKAAMNVQKFIEMVNNKDYESINNVLADGFKNQYSINQNNCNKLINNIFYDLNSLKSATGELQGNYYVIKCEILNEENYNESKKINFIVNLEENLNFEIAFSEDKK